MRRYGKVNVPIGLSLILCSLLGVETVWAKVQVLPETVLLVEGKKVSGHNSVLHHPVVKGLVTAFERAESGLQQEELDRLMQFYAPAYDYHGDGKLRVEVTCTGGLYGTDEQSGKRVTIDSWFREVHYLVKDGESWRFLGNAGDVPAAAPFASAPHHPLF